jgi:hypothetical protein
VDDLGAAERLLDVADDYACHVPCPVFLLSLFRGAEALI